MDGFAGDMLSGGRALLGEDSSVMARMQKKFWKTKQVFIKATGKKEDEYVVASDADLDAKLEFFRSVQSTCTELLKVIEKYQHRITRLSQEENELGLFLRFQGEHDRTKAGNMMDATSKALCTSAKQRMALCPPLHRLHQEVETFRRRAIADTLLTVSRMEKARTEYRGALLWMKDVSQELDPDTYKQLEKFRKVQAQVRGTKGQFEKLKNDVCQKVDMLGASRCNMLSHSLCTYQTTLLQFWEKTAHAMSGIQEAFQGHVPYQFTTLKDLRDPLEDLAELQTQEDKKEKSLQSNTDSLVSLDDDKPSGSASDADPTHSADGQSQNSDSVHPNTTKPTRALQDLRGLSVGSDDDLMLMACDLPELQPNVPFELQLMPPLPGEDPREPRDFGSFQSASLSQLPDTGGLPYPAGTGLRPEEEDTERGDMAFLKDLLSPGPGASDEFSREWQDAFGVYDPPSIPPSTMAPASIGEAISGPAPAPLPSKPPSPTGFLPSQLLDHSLSSTGWATPPMFQAPPLQPPAGQSQSAQPAPGSAANVPPGGSKDMSAWFNLFADLDPLSNPDAIGRSADELLNA
ncbi:islet cell autoantigen 1-like isoform X1 [Larimichthys crocea]|uniref:islet cell autoantigen 1-like isoform X1 n=1 Tax=Larimichthys crocea TaxID=215358 RepID=UPI0009016A79|nr:islet cell autoantigen 1-like protein isoform X1 [Larimichthys crocea]XP_019113009.1 islet cell autoantigen 1-like protein isoform X1 [Larimichthys crocea]XP_019113010.1 islet cell autoantigen 1-like protein isoform X1 [Larimichthys crocea]XP_027147267.1 islet cell autoantigen 1-like protein isoform X1 [Larimichthys crocea]XP_027147268.1 islet cell autoantigen 1-like protein isoform X1 [Larimichthys crocea]